MAIKRKEKKKMLQHKKRKKTLQRGGIESSHVYVCPTYLPCTQQRGHWRWPNACKTKDVQDRTGRGRGNARATRNGKG